MTRRLVRLRSELLPSGWVNTPPGSIDAVAVHDFEGVDATVVAVSEPWTGALPDLAALISALPGGVVLLRSTPSTERNDCLGCSTVGEVPVAVEQRAWRRDELLVTVTATVPWTRYRTLADDISRLLDSNAYNVEVSDAH